MQAAGGLVKPFLVSQAQAAGVQSQPRRRKYQKAAA